MKEDFRLEAHELPVRVIRASGRLRLGVTGSSMLPALRPRDIVILRRCSVGESRVGDIVLFERDSRLFVHRVVRHRGASLVTQGDALSCADAPIGDRDLLGRVERIVRRGRAMRPSRRRPPASAVFRRSEAGTRWFLRLERWRARLGA